MRKNILLFLAFLLILTGCPKPQYMFAPVVKGEDFYNSGNPELSIDSKLVEGETGIFELYKIEGQKRVKVEGGKFSDGKWKPSKALAEGQYLLVVWKERLNQEEETETSLKNEFSFVVDTGAPAAPAVEPAISVYRSSGSGKNIVSTKLLKWKWASVESAAAYEVEDPDGKTVNKNYSDRCFEFLVDSNGDYSINVYAIDSAGNKSSAGSYIFSVDLSSVAGPAINPLFAVIEGKTINTKPEFAWTVVSGDYGDSSVYKVQLCDSDIPDSSKWVIYDLNVPGTELKYSVDYPLSDGKYYFFANSENSIGNVSLSSVYSFTVDNVGPDIPELEVDADVVAVSGKTVNWSWSVSDETEKIGYKLYYPGAVDVEESFVSKSQGEGFLKYSETFDEFSTQGVYRLELRAYDGLNNASLFTAKSVLVNYSKADIPVLSLENGKMSNDKWFTLSLRPKWNISVNNFDEIESIRIALLNENYEEGVTVVNDDSWIDKGAIPFYQVDADLVLADGYGEFSLVVQVKKDDVWGQSAFCNTVVDIKAPAKPVVSGSEVIGALGDPALGFPAWSWPAVSEIVAYRCRINSSPWIYLNNNEAKQYRVTNGVPGSDGDGTPYIFELQGADFIGNWSESGVCVTKVSTSVPASPIVVVESHAVKPEWSWSFPDGLQPLKVWAKIGSEPDPSDSVNGYDFFTDIPLGDGNNRFIAIENQGEAGKESNVVLYVKAEYQGESIISAAGLGIAIVDLLPPPKPLIQGALETGEIRPVWTISSGDESSMAGYRWKIDTDPDSADGWNEIAGNISSVTALSDLSIGKHKFYLKAVDNAGNWSEYSVYTTTIMQGPEPALLELVTTFPDNKTASAKPEFKWTHSAFGELAAFRYRFSSSEDWITVAGPFDSEENNFNAKYTVSQGNITCELQVLKAIGESLISSDSVSCSIYVDSIPPQMPIAGYPVPATSDRTPTLYWSKISDADKYVYSLKKDNELIKSGTINNYEITSFTPDTQLEDGVYRFEIFSQDELENNSSVSVVEIEVGDSFPDPSIPNQIIIYKVSKSQFADAVRIEWVKSATAESYNIFRFSQQQIDSGVFDVNQAVKIADKVNLSDDGNGLEKDNTCVFYDKTISDYSNYYYAVSGLNDVEREGLASSLNSSDAVEKARGCRFGVAVNLKFLSGFSKTGMLLNMHNLDNADEYYISRFVSDSKIDDISTISDWEYYSSSDSWETENPSVQLSDRKVIADSGYDLTGNWELGKFYYFKFFALNSIVKNDSEIATENIVSGEFYKSPVYYSEVLPFPDIQNSWVSIGYNDEDYAGKIPVKITVPQEYKGSLQNMKFEVIRTYNYGGGYRGSANGVETVGGLDMSKNRYPLNPDPDAVSESKTITAYTIDGASFSNGFYLCKDTLYDTDASGNKLIACIAESVPGATHEYASGSYGSRDTYSWFLLTQAQIDAYTAAGQKWGIIRDPDGEYAEHEWHYLIWDWAIRKQLGSRNVGYKNNALKNFNFTEMVECDYQIKLTAYSSSSKNSITSTTAGAPALTPREFAHLGFLLREIIFYHQEASIYNGVIGIGFSDRPSFGHKYCTSEGSIDIYDVSSSLPVTGKIKIHDGTSGKGASDLKDCFIDIKRGGYDYWELTINTNSTNDGYAYLDGELLVDTPLYDGTVFFHVNLRHGTLWERAAAGNFKVSTGNYVEYDVLNQLTPYGILGAGKSYTIINEYATTVYPNAYVDEYDGIWNGRYTDINFTFQGNGYPGHRWDSWNSSWLP